MGKMKRSLSIHQLREQSWRARNKQRCDLCGCVLRDQRVKATHSTGLVFYLCPSCGVPILKQVASLPVG
jgi:rRNA maturation endonuclease Nob1